LKLLDRVMKIEKRLPKVIAVERVGIAYPYQTEAVKDCPVKFEKEGNHGN